MKTQNAGAEFFLKGDNTFVSQVDISVEKYISLALKSLDADIPVFGEELGAEGIMEHSRYWLIDPIDGTAWYRIGVPIYGSLIALIENGEPVIGCISLPGLQQYCYAAKGQGCFLETENMNRTRLSIEKGTTQLNKAVVTASGIHGTKLWLENGDTPWHIDNVFSSAQLFKFTGDCVQHVQVACGVVDAAIDTIMKPWDSAALIVCLREAGAAVIDLHGNQEKLLYSNSLLTAASMPLAQEIIAQLKNKKVNGVEKQDMMEKLDWGE